MPRSGARAPLLGASLIPAGAPDHGGRLTCSTSTLVATAVEHWMASPLGKARVGNTLS